MRPDPVFQPDGGPQDDPDYEPPPPDFDVNEIPQEGLDLDTYTDDDLTGEEEP